AAVAHFDRGRLAERDDAEHGAPHRRPRLARDEPGFGGGRRAHEKVARAVRGRLPPDDARIFEFGAVMDVHAFDDARRVVVADLATVLAVHVLGAARALRI